MRNPSEALKMHLVRSAINGFPSTILFSQIALFTATFFMCKTRLYAEHDSTGFKTALSYQIIAILVSNSRRLSHLRFIHRFIHRTCGYKVNLIANLIGLILAIVLEKFYEKSLSSLGFALSITVLLLLMLVIIQPSTDLGLFVFLIGVIGSVAYNLFRLKFQTWIIVAICFPLLGFRCWLDKNWLEVGEDQSLPIDRSTGGRNQISKSEIIEELTVTGFLLFWVYNLFKTNCLEIKGPPKSISCTSSTIMVMLACVLIFNLRFGLALIPRAYSLFQTERATLFSRRIIAGQEQGPERIIGAQEEMGTTRPLAVTGAAQMESRRIIAGQEQGPERIIEAQEEMGTTRPLTVRGVAQMDEPQAQMETGHAQMARRRRGMLVSPGLKKVEKETQKKEDRPTYKAA